MGSKGRMRVPSTFFMGFVWWLAGFQVLRCAKVCLAWGNFFSLFWVVSKSNVSAFFWLRFRMARALYFFVFSLFLMGSKSDVSAFFRLRFRNGLGTKPAGVLLFRMRVPNTFFLSLAWWLAGFQVLRCAVAWFRPYFFLFNGFQKRRFGIFPAAVSQWLGHKTCWGSAFSHARPKHLFLEFGLVACRLPSLTLRCALLEATFRNLFSLFLVGSKSNVSAVFWLRFRMVWALLLSF